MSKKLIVIAAATALLTMLAPVNGNGAGSAGFVQAAQAAGFAQAIHRQVAIEAEGINEPWGLVDTSSGWIVVSAGESVIKEWNGESWTALAGDAERGYLDSNNASARFNQPTYAVHDDKGILYIADTDNHTVRKLNKGNVYTVAGSGEAGYKDGMNREAQFHAPTGLAVDADQNVYVSDTLNHVIRRITPDGQVSTFAGIAGELGGYADGDAEKAAFNEPMGLAFDEKGGLYVADSGNHLIRYIYEGQVTTFAGQPTDTDEFTGYMMGGYKNGHREQAKFNRPRDLVYEQGVLFVADSLNYRIRAIDASNRVITIAGQSAPGNTVGLPENTQFNQPSALLYKNGRLYIADTLNHNIKSLPVNPAYLIPVRTEEDILAGTELLPASEDIQVWLDGEQLTFDPETKPFIEETNGKLYVPVRSLFEAWGAEVDWDEIDRKVLLEKGNWSLELATSDRAKIILLRGSSYIEMDYFEQQTSFFLVRDEAYNAIVIDSN